MDKRDRGVHYTSLRSARIITEHTLEPLEPSSRPPYSLRVCDPACGDGVFLQAAAEVLAAAWGVPQAEVARRCVYGVDIRAEACTEAHARTGAQVRCGDPLIRWDGLDLPKMHAFVGNPPFVGGSKIRAAYGDNYLKALDKTLKTKGADLCASFFVRAWRELVPGGTMGLIATNTISEGRTRIRGLKRIVSEGGCIWDAMPNVPWSAFSEAGHGAQVIVSVVCIWKPE